MYQVFIYSGLVDSDTSLKMFFIFIIFLSLSLKI